MKPSFLGGRLSEERAVNCSRIRKEWVCDPWSNCIESGSAQKALEKCQMVVENLNSRLTCSGSLSEGASRAGKFHQRRVHHSSQT